MGEGKLRQRQRELREKEIALATARLLVKVDCRTLTMDQVAAVLGTSKASIYRLFTRETLLRRAIQESVREAIEDARRAAVNGQSSEALRRAATSLVDGWLALASRPNRTCAPCCLQEARCPYTDLSGVDRLLRELAPKNGVPTFGQKELNLALALRALAAVRMHQLRAWRRKPTKADTEAVLRYLLPRSPDRRNSRRNRS